MNTKLTVMAILGAFTLTAAAEEFYLKNSKSGKIYGPFDSESGAKITIGSESFTVVKKNESAVEKKLSEINIPAVELRSALLKDSISLLKMEIEEREPKYSGINFIMAKSKSAEKKSDDIFDDFDSESTVTLSLKNVTALQLLNFLMEQTGSTYKTSGDIVTIYPKN